MPPADSAISSSATTSNSVWDIWTATSDGSISGNEVWESWTSTTSGTSANVSYAPIQPYQSSPETEEQKQVRLEELRLRQEKKEAANKAARELLCESLDEDQLKQFNQTEWFYVISQSGKRYRIRCDWVGNIDELNGEGLIVAEYCIHPSMKVPTEDSMLIQKLMLEADEAGFFEIANKTPFHTPRPVLVGQSRWHD